MPAGCWGRGLAGGCLAAPPPATGTRKAVPHSLQRTFLPRLLSDTCRTDRHFRLGQSKVTAMMVRYVLSPSTFTPSARLALMFLRLVSTPLGLRLT